MTSTPLSPFNAHLAALLDAHPEPIMLSDGPNPGTWYAADQSLRRDGEMVDTAPPPPRTGVQIESSTHHYTDNSPIRGIILDQHDFDDSDEYFVVDCSATHTRSEVRYHFIRADDINYDHKAYTGAVRKDMLTTRLRQITNALADTKPGHADFDRHLGAVTRLRHLLANGAEGA